MIQQVLAEEGLGCVARGPQDTPFGSVETREQAKQCAALDNYLGWDVYPHGGRD